MEHRGALLVVVVVVQLFFCTVQAQLPDYVRGNGTYQWLVSKRNRDNGLYFTGANTRLRRVMNRMLKGEPIHITTLGGSNTAGDIKHGGYAWPHYLFNYMADKYGTHVTGNNGAVGGTRSNYMAVCHNMVVPRNVDVVVVEFAINDGDAERLTPEMKRVQERLIRKLLNYPKRPAVILAHLIPWNHNAPGSRTGNWWGGAESAYNELALYYHIPTVSVRGCCFQLLVDSVLPGFNTTIRGVNVEALRNVSFYVDSGHVDGLTGARAVAELVAHSMDKTVESFAKGDPYEPAQEESEDTTLPQPLFPGNYESSADKCFIGRSFRNTVVEAQGFTWINEAKGSRPRWGMVAQEVGSTIHLKINTTAVAHSGTVSQEKVAVLLAYLKSYKHMGSAEITCVRGCACDPTPLQGHHDKHESQIDLLELHITQANECIIQVTVGATTLSGEHKVKLTGLVVHEEAGNNRDMTLAYHQGAVDNVGAVAAKSHMGVFDVKNRDN